jgi:O-antigen/teichoic acid export membrane protein
MVKQDRNKYLLKNTIIFAIGNFASKIISFFFIPLYTNVLTTSEYGTADLVSTIALLVIPLITLNISEAIMRFALDKNADYNKIMSTGMTILLAASVMGLLVVPVSMSIESVRNYSWIIYFYIIASAANGILLYYLRGKELLVQYAIGNIINSFSFAALNITFLLILHLGITGYLLAYAVSQLITAVYAFAVGNVRGVIQNFKLDKNLSIAMIKYSAVLIPNSLMWWIMNSSDRIMVTSMISAAANGIYTVSYKIPSLLNVVSVIFNQAWSYSAIREDDSSDIEDYSNRIYDNMVRLLLLVAVMLMFIIKPFMGIYVEKSYFDAWKYTPYLFTGLVFLTLATFLATQYTVHKDSKGYLFSSSTGALLNILLNWLLIPRWGIAGAAFATCVSYISVFAYRVMDCRKYMNIHVFAKGNTVAYIILFIDTVCLIADKAFSLWVLGIIVIFVALLYRNSYIEFIKSFFKSLQRRKANG